MKIAITGSSGLIGRALVKSLQSSGHKLIHLVRQPQQAGDAAHCWWDPERGIQQLDKLHDIDAVIHLAGRSIAERRWTKREKELIRSSRIEATARLCHDLSQLPHPIKRFVSASATGIYGECGDEIVTEENAAGDRSDFLVRTALDWEAASNSLAGQGTQVIHARFGVVLSPEGGALAKMLPIFRWGLGANLSSGNQYWSWVALEDVVRALGWLVERRSVTSSSVEQSPTAYNIVAPTPVTNREFTRELARAVHRPRFLPVPAFALKILLGEMAQSALLTSCRVIPKRLLDEGFEFSQPTLSGALSSLI